MSSKISGQYEDDVALLRKLLRAKESFDIHERQLEIAGKSASFFFLEAFVKADVMEKMFEFLLKLQPQDLDGASSPKVFAERYLSYVEINREQEADIVVTTALTGVPVLLIDGYDQVFLIDARGFPVRSIDEPQGDRVLRGSHDGFVETLVFNAALIRRRVRDPRLTMEVTRIGAKSKTDVVLCYMDGICDPKKLAALRKKLQEIRIPALAMGQESLAECLCRTQRCNPFPRVRYTERPDCAAASVMEGKILVMVDNSPSVMILPTGIFDFMQDTNDYYFPSLIGTYLRMLRGGVFFLTLFLTPFWYLMMHNETLVPPGLAFLKVAEPNSVPIIVQLLIVELIVDIVKLASLNTPSVLNNAFSLVGALIFGDFAVQAGLFVPEVLLYMAFVSVSGFTQSSYELGYTFKLFRMLFLVLTWAFDVPGFVVGVLLFFGMMAAVRTPLGRDYLYPLIPFNGVALRRLFFRRPISRFNS
ncbi:MAG: spore germination protein [Clostridia bacterium]|nr:spore germination protein [Clostridia bacterium]